MKCARAKRAKLLSFIVKDANLRRSCRSRCHGYFSSLFFKDMADDDNDDDDDNNNVLGVVDVVDHNDKKWDTRKKESSRYLSATQWGGGWAVCCPLFFCCLFVFFVFSGLLRFFLNELFSFSYFRFRPSGVPRRTPDLTSQQALSERMAKYYRDRKSVV